MTKAVFILILFVLGFSFSGNVFASRYGAFAVLHELFSKNRTQKIESIQKNLDKNLISCLSDIGLKDRIEKEQLKEKLDSQELSQKEKLEIILNFYKDYQDLLPDNVLAKEIEQKMYQCLAEWQKLKLSKISKHE